VKQVVFSLAAAKALRKLPTEVREQIIQKIQRYADTGSGDVKALQGRAGFRLRSGDYRVLFQEAGTVVEVLEIGNRRDIYR
jgi:mRNA interferase RelE/StbE